MKINTFQVPNRFYISYLLRIHVCKRASQGGNKPALHSRLNLFSALLGILFVLLGVVFFVVVLGFLLFFKNCVHS